MVTVHIFSFFFAPVIQCTGYVDILEWPPKIRWPLFYYKQSMADYTVQKWKKKSQALDIYV